MLWEGSKCYSMKPDQEKTLLLEPKRGNPLVGNFSTCCKQAI